MIRIILLLLIILVACQPDTPSFTFDDLPEGDPARGETLFSQSINEAPTCSGCHFLSEARSEGPGLANLAAGAANRVSGESAAVYIFNSITRPARHIVRGFSNVMYDEYAEKLSHQDIADLIAFLLQR